MKKWEIGKNQKELLNTLFEKVKIKEVKSVFDIGTGRTSLEYLTNKFKNTNIQAVVYPGDERKINPILECVSMKNYKIIESDIKNLKNKKADLVLAHMFLGEAEKFGKNKFNEVLESLFSLKTKYLIIVNIDYDKIDYFSLLKYISKKGKLLKIANQQTSDGHECLGFTIKN